MTSTPCIKWGLLCTIVLMSLVVFCGPSFGDSHGPCDNLTLAEGFPSSNPLSGEPVAMREGCLLYRKWCRQCHGNTADGTGVRWAVGAKNLQKYWQGYSQFIAIVIAGRPKKQMPPWAGVLSGEQISQIGTYLETLAIEGANWKDN